MQYPQSQKSSSWAEGRRSGAALSPTTHCQAGNPAMCLAGRVGRSNPLYWTPRSVFFQGGYIRLGLHNQILLSHRRLLQRSETQRFSCLLAHVGCAGFCTAGEALQKDSKEDLSSLTSLFTTTGVPPAQIGIFLGSERAQTAKWRRPAVLSSNKP